MIRKDFLQLNATLLAGQFLPPLSAGSPDQGGLQNWAGNMTYSTRNVLYPKSVQELQSLIKKQPKLKALGTMHCFNRIADSTDQLLVSKNLNKPVSLDEKAGTVTVEGGIKYGELAPWLAARNYALHNLASLPHISVAGSITTATHGSGIRNGNLSSAVTGLEMVLADGSIVQFSRAKDADKFDAVVVGLGAIGFITKVTLKTEQAFQVRQRVFLDMPLQQMKDHFEEIMSAGYSVSLFYDWQTDKINEVWIKSRVDKDRDIDSHEFFGAIAATKNVHPIVANSPENCTDQMGVPGAWYERLPHFKMGFTPSNGAELQAEYFVPLKHAVEAIEAVRRMGKEIGPHLFITEIRTIAEDKLWMSPCYHQTSVAIHFTWKREPEAVLKLLPRIEAALAPYNVRPHWGKLFTIPHTVLASRYERMEDFQKLVATYDPKGKFRNRFLDINLYGK
jgi:xylitol oxidase